jgi:AcrR family transcriptional regulator
MVDTKQRILDTAERLFAENGYAGTSMRHVIADAGVNLAAIHYHFGSKEELLDTVVSRRAEPVNAERIARLEAAKIAAGGGSVPVEVTLDALLRPMANAAAGHEQFVRFMGRVHAEGMLPHVVKKHFHHVMVRFMAALREALPDLQEQEFLWRVHFMMGAISQTMCATPESLKTLGVSGGFEERLDRLKRFLCAGFRAPGES